MDGEEVWVAETWGAHGDGMSVHGVYSSREAAWDDLKGEVETLYVGEDGNLHGKPRDEERRRRAGLRYYWGPSPRWALASPMRVRGRQGT